MVGGAVAHPAATPEWRVTGAFRLCKQGPGGWLPRVRRAIELTGFYECKDKYTLTLPYVVENRAGELFWLADDDSLVGREWNAYLFTKLLRLVSWTKATRRGVSRA